VTRPDDEIVVVRCSCAKCGTPDVAVTAGNLQAMAEGLALISPEGKMPMIDPGVLARSGINWAERQDPHICVGWAVRALYGFMTEEQARESGKKIIGLERAVHTPTAPLLPFQRKGNVSE